MSNTLPRLHALWHAKPERLADGYWSAGCRACGSLITGKQLRREAVAERQVLCDIVAIDQLLDEMAKTLDEGWSGPELPRGHAVACAEVLSCRASLAPILDSLWTELRYLGVSTSHPLMEEAQERLWYWRTYWNGRDRPLEMVYEAARIQAEHEAFAELIATVDFGSADA